ncbi:MAG: prolipoprotein diacylglyceryl transferase [Chloroflexi bacterium]|nr:prolipoprotein diacylglyceryl transferase [Chloroflexota bacterium]
MIINVNPVAFSIGPLDVAWYGITIAVAVVVLVAWTLRGIKREPALSADTVINATMLAIPFALVVSRLLHVMDQWGYYGQHPAEIIGGSGLTIWGAILGATLGVWVYSRIHPFPFARLTDIAAPGIILAQAIGRVGCLLNGCCYGLETSAFCGIIYVNPGSYGPIGVAVHPTQVYEIFFNFAVFLVLLRLRDRLKPDGALFLIYLSLYSSWRIGIGFLRENTALLFGLNEAQIIGFVILGIAIPVLAARARWTGRVQG